MRHWQRAITAAGLGLLTMAENHALAQGKTYPLWDGQETQAAYAKKAGLALEQVIDLGNNVLMEFILIPAGKFMMGRPGPTGVPESSSPRHEVTLTKPYYVGVYEVTMGQYEQVMGTNVNFKRSTDMTWAQAADIQKGVKGKYTPEPNLPVDWASWYEAMAFCRAVTERSGKFVCLPSEAQWEHAARAGTTHTYFFGDDRKMLDAYAWFVDNDGTHPAGVMPVGQKKPNPWGLHDVLGNVVEWTLDFEPLYKPDPVIDPVAPLQGAQYQERAVRGGYWGGYKQLLQQVYADKSVAIEMYKPDSRTRIPPEYKMDVVHTHKRMPGAGFRVMAAVEKPASFDWSAVGPQGLAPLTTNRLPVSKIPDDFFSIGAWGTDSQMDKWTDELFQGIADCNFTMVFQQGNHTVIHNAKLLDLCKRHGLMSLLVDREFYGNDIQGPGFPGKWPKTEWRRKIRQVTERYGRHPALWGYLLFDEPQNGLFYDMGYLNGLLKEEDPNHPGICDLFPTYGVGWAGIQSYETYLDNYMRLVKPRVLLYDHYTLIGQAGREGIRQDFYYNMDLFRDRALKADIPFWGFVLATGHLGLRNPSEGELAWQAYSLLAYGAQGIQYFTYAQFGESVGLIDKDGKKSERWEFARRLNGEIRAMAPVLLRLKSTAVYHVGELAGWVQKRAGTLIPDMIQHDGSLLKGCRALEPNGEIEKVQNANIVVGLFMDGDGNNYAILVNKNYKAACKAKVGVAAGVKGAEAFNCATSKWEPVTLVGGKDFELPLEAGRGKLLRFN